MKIKYSQVLLATLFLSLLPLHAANGLEGRWKGTARHSDTAAVEFWLNIKDGVSLSVTMDINPANAAKMGFSGGIVGMELTGVDNSGDTLSWTVPVTNREIACRTRQSGTDTLEGECRQGEAVIAVRLDRTDESLAAAATIELVHNSAAEERYTRAVERVPLAIKADDFELFESYFVPTTVGMQPNELWRGALGVLLKFGPVHRIEFSEMDGDAAFVKVHFQNASRELVVQFGDKDKLRELSYVPPTAPVQ